MGSNPQHTLNKDGTDTLPFPLPFFKVVVNGMLTYLVQVNRFYYNPSQKARINREVNCMSPQGRYLPSARRLG